MGRRSAILVRPGRRAGSRGDRPDVIQVVSRALDILRCFDGPLDRLGNRELASRSGLPRSTVSRLACTLTQLGHLSYFADDMKYGVGPSAVELSAAIIGARELRRWTSSPSHGGSDPEV